MNLFLKPVVDSMIKLGNEGLSVSLKGTEHHYKVSLLAFLADNLGAHAVGGFKVSFSFAYQICRSCMATTDPFWENPPKRGKINYLL